MSKLSDELSLELPLEQASMACRSSIASIGWNIKSMDDRRIVPTVGVGISRNPSNIEVLLASADDSRTTVTLNGSIVGIGPVQKSHLRGGMNRLRNAIEVAASQSLKAYAADQSGAERDAVEQLRKLGEPRDAGVLSDEEFEAKKAELLGRI
jgi:Short C-terminal domain